jgi:hypothetical protein
MAERKPRPEPIEEAESLEQKLERAARDDVDRELRVSLLVAGGAPSQRYRFHFAAEGSGRVHCEWRCELSGREAANASRRKLDRKQFADLVRTLEASGMLEVPAEQPRFEPDTIVGTLELSDGRSSLIWDFAADPEQAKTQGVVPPFALKRAADEIYSLGAKLMGKRASSVKP